MRRTILCLLAIILFAINHTFAADTTTRKKGILLVMLHSEQNRLNAARKVNNQELLTTIAHDAEQVRIRTIMDFTENFSHYPVYYVMDSNYDKIARKQFAGIIMNADGTTATNVAIDTAKPNYLIAYYGTGDFQINRDSPLTEKEKEKYNPNSGTHGLGLVVYNSKFEQLTHLYKMAYSNPSTLPLEEAKKLPTTRAKRYFYKSRKFEMEYYPFAESLNKSFGKRNKKAAVLP